MAQHHVIVAVFDTHPQAEDAVRQLERSGTDLKSISIIGKGYQPGDNIVGYYDRGDRMRAWGESGAFWGGLWGLLAGSAFFFIPGLGPLFFAGPIVAGLLGALEGAAVGGGIGVLSAALARLGIPAENAADYERAAREHKYLLIVHGTAETAAATKKALEQSGATPTLHAGAAPIGQPR